MPTLVRDDEPHPSCGSMDDGFLFGWTGPGITRVEVTVEEHPVRRLALRAWARELWRRAVGSNAGFREAVKEGRLRFWESPTGRGLEWTPGPARGEVDPVWAVTRFQERRGHLLRVHVIYYGRPPQSERDALRTAFVDGPLGPPPP